MIEIEAKVWLDKKGIDHQSILRLLEEYCDFVGKKKKSDFYFKREGEKEEHVRFREQNGVFLVTHKQYAMKNGVEMNEEIEFEVDNQQAFFQFMVQLGYSCSRQKTKETYEFAKNGFHYELNFVDGLGWFLEIEKICTQDMCIDDEKHLLESAFEHFHFRKSDFEERRYLELLDAKK